jgi:hypothetical protein
MQVRCTNCFHLKKVPGKMTVFCKMEKLPEFFHVSRAEFTKKGVIRLAHRKIFDIAKSCPTFVSMDDEESPSISVQIYEEYQNNAPSV